MGLHVSLEINQAGAVIPHFDIIRWYLHTAMPCIQSFNMQNTPYSLLSWVSCVECIVSILYKVDPVFHFPSPFQCLWRCYAAEPRSNFHATWRIHMQDHPSRHHPNAFSKVARRASIIKQKRRISKGRFDLAGLGNHIGDRKDSEASVMFLPDEHRPSTGRSFYMRTLYHGNAFCITGPLVGGIHWSWMDSPHKGPAVWSFGPCFNIWQNVLL